MDVDFFVGLSLITLLLYMWSFGLFGLCLYLHLITRSFFNKTDKEFVEASLNTLINIGIFPSIILVLFMVIGFSKPWVWSIPIFFLNAKDLKGFFYGLIFSLLWWMPAMFLPIRYFFNQHKNYHKIGVLWYGIIVACLICQIYWSVPMLLPSVSP